MFNPLFLKIGLGGAVVTGAGTTGIIYREKIKTFVENQFSKSNAADTQEKDNKEPTDVTENSVTTPTDTKTEEVATVDSGTTEASSQPQQSGTTAVKAVVVPSTPGMPPVVSSTYVIVKTKTVADADITNELYAGETKNFKCVLTNETNKEDDTCSIFSITAPTDNKLNNLKDIKDSTTQATKDTIKNNIFFKLTIKDDLLNDITWDGTQTIDIVSKTEEASAAKKKYGSFTLQYKVTDAGVEGKTNLIIGKITAKSITTDLSVGPNFKCSLSDESDKKDCSLFKIANTPTEIKDVVLAGVKTATKTNTEYEKDCLYVIDLKRTTDKKNISDFKTKNVIVVNQATSEEEALATFEFQAALSETEESFSDSNVSKIIFA